jgi:hypothetical protein
MRLPRASFPIVASTAVCTSHPAEPSPCEPWSCLSAARSRSAPDDLLRDRPGAERCPRPASQAPPLRRVRTDAGREAQRPQHLSGEAQNGHSGAPKPASGLARRPRIGDYLRGCAKTEVALRDELSLSLRPRPAGFAAADRPHAKGPGPAMPMALDAVRGMSGHSQCWTAMYRYSGRAAAR